MFTIYGTLEMNCTLQAKGQFGLHCVQHFAFQIDECDLSPIHLPNNVKELGQGRK
jgi:hypothetical protein